MNEKIFCFYNIYDEFDELFVSAETLEDAYYTAGYDYVLEDIIEGWSKWRDEL